jgi:lysyl-tRNA synthetase class 2
MPGYRQSAISKNLYLRAKIIAIIREFFLTRNYLEVETPYRVPSQAPETYIDAEPSADWFLHTSPEICMKRLLAAGYAQIFQICKCFRKGERSHRHLPEMTMLEWYRSLSNYWDMMDETEALIREVAEKLKVKMNLRYGEKNISLSGPWHRFTVREAFTRYADISMEKALYVNRFDEIMGIDIEPNLGCKAPVFLYDYPIERGALARQKHDDLTVVERFELYIGGLELCNAFTELTDTLEQKKRFEKALQFRKNMGRPAYLMPEKFLASLKDMPAASGCALGVDRLVMLFANTNRIDDIIAFTPEEL